MLEAINKLKLKNSKKSLFYSSRILASVQVIQVYEADDTNVHYY